MYTSFCIAMLTSFPRAPPSIFCVSSFCILTDRLELHNQTIILNSVVVVVVDDLQFGVSGLFGKSRIKCSANLTCI